MTTTTVLSRDAIVATSREVGFPAVSIYMSTHILDHGVGGDSTAFRNLLRAAEESLLKLKTDPGVVAGLLADGRALIDDRDFWKDDAPGLAFFASTHSSHALRLPEAVPESVFVGSRFTITPLLPILNSSEVFYVLGLNLGGARLFHADSTGLTEVLMAHELPDFRSFLDTLEVDRNLQFKSSRVGAGGGRMSTNFGNGTGDDDTKKYVADYFRTIDRSVTQHINGTNRPLVLAGVEYLLPIYRQVSHYPMILDGEVAVNTADMEPAQLHAMAWEIVYPMFKRREDAALEQLAALAGTGRTSTALEEIVAASAAGRVQNLFLTTASTAVIGSHEDVREQLNEAALGTLATGGEVVSVEPGRLYDNADVAAIFRY